MHIERQWAALTTEKRAKCSVCGAVFSTDSSFDRHRKGNHFDKTRHCVDPETVGLVLKQVKSGWLYARPGRKA